MTQIYLNALSLVMKRIVQCGHALQSVSDEYSVSYWQMQLAQANFLKMRIQKRLKMNHNAIKVDFKTKRRAA